jgi:ABC-type Fe3+ transport system substrate-binding protein
MIKNPLINATLIVMMCATLYNANAASSSADLLSAKKEAEARGYLFLSKDDIVAKARTEGKLRVYHALLGAINPLVETFKRKYPFIQIQVEEFLGTDVYQRTLLELKAGRVRSVDVVRAPSDFYHEYLPYLKKIDVLGMAKHGVLSVPTEMIDPNTRNVVAVVSRIQVVAYNKNLIATERVPAKWEDFLKPEFKGKKFLAEIRPTEIAALVPAWGLEKTLDFARKLATQNPVWIRGAIRALASITAGDHALFLGPNYDLIRAAMAKDATRSMGLKIVEPVPARVSEELGILETAENPHAALLWLEFLASPEGQKIIDKLQPGAASLFTAGSVLRAETSGKQLSLVTWADHTKLDEWQEKVIEAYGFPKADKS